MPQSSKIDWAEFKREGEAQLGKVYLWGAVADISCQNVIAFDCAELPYWLYGRRGIKIPNYSGGQYKASVPEGNPRLGDLGFWKIGDSPAHHSGIFWDNEMVLEARGCDKHEGHHGKPCPYNKVIFRPRSKWETWKQFTGWRRPVAVLQAERS